MGVHFARLGTMYTDGDYFSDKSGTDIRELIGMLKDIHELL